MSTRELINGSGTVATRYSYDAWGMPTETKLVASVSTRLLHLGSIYWAVPVLTGRNGNCLYDPAQGRRIRSMLWLGSRSRSGLKSHFYAVPLPGLAKYAALSDCLLGYCVPNRIDCMEACWQDTGCWRRWTMGACAHSCQCYGARCAWGCSKGYDWETGEPFFGRSKDAIEQCHTWICNLIHIGATPYFGDETRDDVINPGNVCGSEYKTHTEWNAVWYSRPTRFTLPSWLPGWLRLCRTVCWYGGTIFNPPLRPDPWAGKEHAERVLAVHEWDNCPAIMPGSLSKKWEWGYFPINGEPNYPGLGIWGGEWLAWNSCPRSLIWGR